MKRRAGLAALLVCALCLPATQAQQGEDALAGRVAVASVLDGPFPSRARGLQLAAQGQHLLDERRIPEALATLRRAIREDPVLDAAWSGLASAAIADCRRDEALFAAYQAAYLNPEAKIPIQQLRAAKVLQCPARETSDASEKLEAQLAHEIHNPALWRAAAEARSALDERLLSAFYLERALVCGADPATVRPELLDRLEQAGLWRASLRLSETFGAEQDREARLHAMLDSVAPRATRLALELGPRLNTTDDESRARLRECAEVLIANAPESGETAWRDELLALFGKSISARIAFEGGSLELDSSWSRWNSDSELAESAQLGLLVLRRFPGDTQLSLFGVSTWTTEAALGDAIVIALKRYNGRRVAEWTRCPSASQLNCRKSVWSISTAAGDATVDLFAFEQGAGRPVIVALLIAGTGGYDATGRADARAAAATLIATIRVENIDDLRAASDADEWNVPLPQSWRASDRPRESEEPWLSFPLGSGLRLDLPGAVSASRETPSLDSNSAGPPGATLYWRASFLDREGRLVQVGDKSFWAWARPLPSGTSSEWTAPPSDPQATFERTVSLDAAFVAAGSAWRGSVAQFRGKAWRGKWLIARVVNGPETVEIAQPVTEETESLSLLWIPVTVRHDGEAGPPPLIERAGGQAIRIQPFGKARSATDPREGLLSASDFEVALPRGFRVSATPSSSDGLPLTLRHADGSQFVIEHWDDSLPIDTKWRSLAEGSVGGAITTWRQWSRGRAQLALARADTTEPPTALLLARSGEGKTALGLRILFKRGTRANSDAWDSSLQLMSDTLKFTRRGTAAP